MGTIFVHRPSEDNTTRITNTLGQALQIQFFYIDLDVIGGTLVTSKIYEQ